MTNTELAKELREMAKSAPQSFEAAIRAAADIVADYERVKHSEQIYRDEFTKTVEACAWMHYDKTLGINIGDRLTVDGILALKKQRDELRAIVAALHEDKTPLYSKLSVALQERDSLAEENARMRDERNAAIKMAWELVQELVIKCREPIHKRQLEIIRELHSDYILSNDPSSATAATERNDCNQSGPPPFAGARG